jgi:hypothetical protein
VTFWQRVLHYWPWQETQRERDQDLRIAELEFKLQVADIRMEALGEALIQRDNIILAMKAAAQQYCHSQGVSEEFFLKRQDMAQGELNRLRNGAHYD